MVQTPCMIITGSKDVNVQMESFIKSTEFLSTSTLRIIDNASHFPHQEQPQVVNNILISFLGKPNLMYIMFTIHRQFKMHLKLLNTILFRNMISILI